MHGIGIGLVCILFLQVSSFVLCDASIITSTTLGQHDESTRLLGNFEEVTVSTHNEDNLLNYYNSSNHEDVLEGSGLEEQQENTENDTLDPLLKNCREPGYQKICSGHGMCVEGECRCDNPAAVLEQDPTYRYSGRYCEECPYCNGQRCDNFLPCITCKLVEGSTHCPTCPAHYTAVNTVTRNVTNDDKICNMDFDTGCYIRFKYYYRDNDVYLETENIVECYHGGVYMFYIYWGLIFLLVLLMAVTPKMCLLFNPDPKLTDDSNCIATLRNRRFLYNEIRPTHLLETQL